MSANRILVTGASGQLGTVLTEELRNKYGSQSVIASDIQNVPDETGPFVMLDILNTQRLAEVVEDFGITQVYHLAAILSANGEWNPSKTWNVNFNGWKSILELSLTTPIERVFFPSTIAVFGSTTPRVNTPQHGSFEPTTVYGISKLSGELLGNYYYKRYGLDVRSLRYPGIIGYQSLPGGGTTDYAVEIFHTAIAGESYTCFLHEDTRLPMIYMSDAIRATIELMEARPEQLSIRTAYNLSAISFTPAELAESIQGHFPDFKVIYEPDFRQEIADSWPESINDQPARNDWGWGEQYNLENMCRDMIFQLKKMK